MAAQSVQIISLEVSPFDYDDYCNLFDTYNNEYENIELMTIIDNLGFNINRPNAIITKANGEVIASKIASNQAEMDEYMKDAVKIMQLGIWTNVKWAKDKFESEKSKLFSHSCKINYQIKCSDADEIIHIRRIYTMSSRLNTVQMIEFILETDETNNNIKRWKYFDITKSNLQSINVNKKYILACKKIYDFYIEKDFEEIDDEQMWEHQLFQTGLHLIEC